VTVELVKDCDLLHGLFATVHNGTDAPVTVQVTDSNGPPLGAVTVPAGATATKVLGVVIQIANQYDLRYLNADTGAVIANFASDELFVCVRHYEYHIRVVSGAKYRSPPHCPSLFASRPKHGRVRTVDVTNFPASGYEYTADRGYAGPDQFELSCGPVSAESTGTVFVTVLPAPPAHSQPLPAHSQPLPATATPQLPNTGTPPLGWLTTAGLAALLLGAAAALAARQRRSSG
jgi:LPXTG-motif cell wall-anchored protein